MASSTPTQEKLEVVALAPDGKGYMCVRHCYVCVEEAGQWGGMTANFGGLVLGAAYRVVEVDPLVGSGSTSRKGLNSLESGCIQVNI